VEHLVDLLYMPASSGEKFFLGAFTIVVWVDSVVGQDIGCCNTWTIWRQAVSFMSRLVCLTNLTKARSSH